MKDPRTFSLATEKVSIRPGIFDALHEVLTGVRAPRVDLNVTELLTYCVLLDRELTDLGHSSRLVDVEMAFARDASAKTLTLVALIPRGEIEAVCGDVPTFEASSAAFMAIFHRVNSPDDPSKIRYETTPVTYTYGLSTHTAVRTLRSRASSLRLFRSPIGYAEDDRTDYLLPLDHHGRAPLPEGCVLLAIAFYLGTLVRYQPHIYDHLLGSEEAWLLESFVRQCPLAFAHLLLHHLWREEHIFKGI